MNLHTTCFQISTRLKTGKDLLYTISRLSWNPPTSENIFATSIQLDLFKKKKDTFSLSFNCYGSGSDINKVELFHFQLFDESWDIPIYDGIILTFTPGSKLVR